MSASTPRASAIGASPTRLGKHSVAIAGHRTSITIETAFWNALAAIARRRKTTIAALIARIDDGRAQDPAAPNLSSAIRVFVLRDALSETKPEP